MIWPERPGSWAYEAREARKAFCSIAEAIVESEQVYMLVSERQYENALQMLSDKIRLVIMDSDDAWARDTGPTFVVSGDADVSYKDRILSGSSMHGAVSMMDCMLTGAGMIRLR